MFSIIGFIRFNRRFKRARDCTLSFWKGVPGLSRAHLETAKGSDDDQERYCSKEGRFKTWGCKEVHSKTDYEEVFELVKEDLWGAIEQYPKLAIKHYGSMRGISDLYCLQSSRNGQHNRFEGCELRSWQRKALDLFLGQSDRQILFCVDSRGNSGKSWLAKYILFTMDAWGCQGGGIKDLMYSYKNQKYCVFDMARCNDPKFYPWNFMENLKNGWFCNLKYESRMSIFEPPKIIVMTNSMPPYDKFSIDRYLIFDVMNEETINHCDN